MTAPSIRSRFTVALINSGIRAAISFCSGTLVARALGPDLYGDYAFLIGSFAAARTLLDLGTSSAFYTFICREPRNKRFTWAYLVWQLAQLGLGLVTIGLILPPAVLQEIWINQGKSRILLAFLAVFLQQQSWQTILQIGESRRLTHKTQLLTTGMAVLQLALFAALWVFNALTLERIFSVIAIEYALGFIAGIRMLEIPSAYTADDKSSTKDWIREFVKFCSPLVLYIVISFLYAFLEPWFLQKYSGARQQGYYGVANQYSAIVLLATTAMLNIFWKEIAEAHAQNNSQRVSDIYLRTSRLLLMVGAAVAGMLIPWSREITLILLGPSYTDASLVLAIMLFYPVHQSWGQLNGAMLYATGRTRVSLTYGVITMLISILVSYFLLAPQTATIPGLGLGATGLALKTVIINLISVNALRLWFTRHYSFQFDWKEQIGYLALCGGLGFFWMFVTTRFITSTPLAFCAASLLYCSSLAWAVWLMPQAVGATRSDLTLWTQRALLQLKAGKS